MMAGEELIAFCFVTFLFTGGGETRLENPWPRYHYDTNICMIAADKMGEGLRAIYTAQGRPAQALCGCMGKKEAQRLEMVPMDPEAKNENYR